MKKGTRVSCRITNPSDAHMSGVIGVVARTVKPGQLIPVRLPGQTVLWKFFPEELTVQDSSLAHLIKPQQPTDAAVPASRQAKRKG